MADAAHAAAKAGRASALRAALAAGSKAEWRDEANACAPLHWAAYGGHVDCVRLLLAHGAEVEAAARDGCTPLHSAAAQGHAACCRLLLDGGSTVDAKDLAGRTPLWLAAERGYADCCALLLSRGAAMDAASATGVSVLQAATGDARALLVPAVAHVTATAAVALPSQLRRGVRVSWLKAWTDQHDAWLLPTWRVVQEIIVPATASSRDVYSALPEAEGGFGLARVFASHAWGAPWGSLVSALVSSVLPETHVWIDVFAICQHAGERQIEDLRALKAVVKHADVLLLVVYLTDDAAQLLSGDGAPTIVQLLAHNCGTVLPQLRIWCVFEIFTATTTPRPIVIKLGGLRDGGCEFVPNTNSKVLVNLKNTVDCRQAQATQPDDRALILGEVEATGGADLLNSKVSGALLGAFSCADWPEVVAAACGDSDALDALVRAGSAALDEPRGRVKQTAAHAAAGAGFTQVLRQLMSAGADPMARNLVARTPLHRAAEGGHLECIALLLGDARVRVEARDDMGNGALYLAAAAGQLAALEALEAAGADLRAANKKGATALHTACVNAQLPMVKYLLSRGFDAALADAEANTPVMRACWGGSVPVLEMLMAAGATLEGADCEGMTAAMCAADSGHAHVLRWLAAAGARFDGRTTAAWHSGAGKCATALAAEGDFAEALEYLLSRPDAEAGALDAAGRSLMTLATEANAGDAVLRLLGAGSTN